VVGVLAVVWGGSGVVQGCSRVVLGWMVVPG